MVFWLGKAVLVLGVTISYLDLEGLQLIICYKSASLLKNFFFLKVIITQALGFHSVCLLAN